MRLRKIIIVSLILITNCALAQKPKDARMAWWREAKFGMFIHFGLYAIPAGEYKGVTSYGEWIMKEAGIPVNEYEKYAEHFNPTGFNADEWVRMARDAGMKYVILTSKHHDGFCLWPSKYTDYDVEDATPFKRDILMEVRNACDKYGIKFGLYHSIMDWHHPMQKPGTMDQYRNEYLKPQLKELVENYRPAVLWFDGEWIDEWTPEQGREIYDYLLQLNPEIIVNNRVGKGRVGMQGMDQREGGAGDFGTPEQEVLAAKTDQDWESCMTMNNHWGYNKTDTAWKSTETLLWHLANSVAKGGNYLLNVGPMANGKFPERAVNILDTIGKWMKSNSPAIYGVKPWEHTTEGNNMLFASKGNGKQFAYLKGATPGKIRIKSMLMPTGKKVRMLPSARNIPWAQDNYGLQFTAPAPDKSLPAIRVFEMEAKPAPLSGAVVLHSRPTAAYPPLMITPLGSNITIAGPKSARIFYTQSKADPAPVGTLYKTPIRVTGSTLIRAAAVETGKRPGETSELEIVQAPIAINLLTIPADRYTANGPLTLLDGVKSDPGHFHGVSLGWNGKDAEFSIDLGKNTGVNKLKLGLLRNHGQWIFLPTAIELYGTDKNGRKKLLVKMELPKPAGMEADVREEVGLSFAAGYRFLTLKLVNAGTMPAWHPGNGALAWTFLDEVEFE